VDRSVLIDGSCGTLNFTHATRLRRFALSPRLIPGSPLNPAALDTLTQDLPAWRSALLLSLPVVFGVTAAALAALGPSVRASAICQASSVSTASAGRSVHRLGIARSEASVSTGWCVGPSSPRPIESWVKT